MTIDIVLALLNNPSVISDYQPSAISPAVLSSGMKKAASVAEARSATTTPTPTTILSFASSDAAAKDSRGIVYNYHQLLKNPESLSMQQDLIQLTVNVLREQRVSMVQTIEQYVFCYEAILTRFLQLKAKSRNYRHKQHKIYYSNASGKQESISSESGAISSTQSEPFLLPNIMSGLEAEEEKELGVSIASSSSHQHNHHNNFQHQLRHHHWQQQQQRQSSVSPSRKVSVWVAAGAETTSSDDAKSTMGIKETQSSKMGSSLAGGDAYSDEEAEVLSNMGYKETQSSKMGSSMAGGDDDDGESDGGEEMEVKSNMGLKDTQSSKIGSSMASRDENNDGGEEAEILSNMGYKETQSSKKANSEAGDVD